jgi:hypothetical protein
VISTYLARSRSVEKNLRPLERQRARWARSFSSGIGSPSRCMEPQDASKSRFSKSAIRADSKADICSLRILSSAIPPVRLLHKEDRARPIATVVLQSERGRGPQMHAGAARRVVTCSGLVTPIQCPPSIALSEIDLALAASEVVGGNFGLVFDGSSRSARQLTMVYPWLRLLGLCYGDAGIFVRRSVYECAGGFRSYALFEDLDLIRRIKRFGTFVHLPCSLTTSSRRFENRNFGVVWANWIALQALYWMGVSPNLLARWYRHVR